MHPDTRAELHEVVRQELLNDPMTRGYGGKTAAEIAALMNEPIVVSAAPRVKSFRWREARAIAQGAGEWPRIVVRSRQTPTLPPASATDGAILAAINAVSMEADQQLDPDDAIEAAAFAAGIAALVAVGDLSQPVADRIVALGVEVPAPETHPSRWSAIIDHICGVGNEPGPPNAATAALVQEALDGGG